MNNKVLFAAGLGSTGSSALVDLLKEVDGFYSMDDEFRLIVDPDGLINLRDALVENWSVFQTDSAIRRFRQLVHNLNYRYKNNYVGLNHSKYFGEYFIKKSNEFIDSICDLKFRGLWYGNATRLQRKLNYRGLGLNNDFGSNQMYVGKNLSEQDFSINVQEFIYSLVNYILENTKKDFFCFNENLSCMFPEKILNMIPGAKIIVVVRDPKDVFADSLRVKWAAIPHNSREFIKWQISVYSSWMKVYEKYSSIKGNELNYKVVKFEDLVGNYEATKKDIFDFLGIESSKHIGKGTFLNPTKSIKNVAQWKTVLNKEEIELFDEHLGFFYKKFNY